MLEAAFLLHHEQFRHWSVSTLDAPFSELPMPQRRPSIAQLFFLAAAMALLLPPVACGYVGPDLTAGDNAGVGGHEHEEAAGGAGLDNGGGGTVNATGGTWSAAAGNSSFGGDQGFGGEGGDFFASICTNNCTCDIGRDCEFTCDPAVNICRPECLQGSRCLTDANQAEEVTINCTEGSTCYATGADHGATKFSCNGGGDCHVSCGEGSSCALSCTGFGDCSLDCGAARECTLSCGNPNGCQMNPACSNVVTCEAGDPEVCRSTCELEE
jgi:hypothetical protein